jgi:amino acid transporter
MARMKFRIPLWLKIFLALLVLILFVSAFEAVAYFMTTVFFLLLIIFPGPDLEKPRLVKLYPWVMGLSAIVTVVVLFADYRHIDLFGGNPNRPSGIDLWTSLVFTPFLLWSFIKRNQFFRPLLLLSAAVSIVESGMDFVHTTAVVSSNLLAYLELFGNISSELILTVYLWKKVRVLKKAAH